MVNSVGRASARPKSCALAPASIRDEWDVQKPVPPRLEDESRLLEHQFAAQTPGSPSGLAHGNAAGRDLFAGNEMHRRTVSRVGFARRWISFCVSWPKIV